MRSMLAATLMLAAATGAHAQMTAPQVPGTKPKPVQTVPVRPPAVQTASETADAMAQAERLSLQSDLAWVGQYNGAITGDVSERMVNAIKEYQKAKGGKPTGVLNPQERAALADTARRKQDGVGWKIVMEPTSGARLGIPSKLVPQQASDANGSKWTSPTGTVQVLLSRRKEASPTTAKLADAEKKEPAGRKVDYTVVKPDFFVLSGLQGLKKFYVRGTFRGDEVRIMTILYDQAMENTVEPIVIAMSSAFNAFPSTPMAGPPPRKNVEYGTGIVVSDDGAILADRLVTDSCLAITIAGFGSADRLAEDKEHDLALLHIYGARGLKPLSLIGGGVKTSVDVVGIADPQSQGGAAGISSVKGALAPVTSSDSALSPPPAVGFSGGPAIDGDGKFAGVALLKPAMVAGPASAVPASQAVMVSAEAVRDFLKANGVSANGTSMDAKAAVVRVICVRK
ncbi:peptidoglycan hydrolase-like protein with peptidoglycan-binding domain [Bradyrhizobium sp. cir1]|uniref:peptidoglycan-binding protein n=1 Tax=Bradyrhizobium sp. cir1 TaxID=1445730 RepID=UPI001606814C|nr:peptidoglycan-binding protein [Bradyrhizobium sp. cir1]MBB4373979.1 peptidoglycan hydrolase-like protein with peptidoglycan-binding domain [Bradyrhizobium sp. cir1]